MCHNWLGNILGCQCYYGRKKKNIFKRELLHSTTQMKVELFKWPESVCQTLSVLTQALRCFQVKAGQEAFRAESQTYTEPNVNSKRLSDSSMTRLTFPCSDFQSLRGTAELSGLDSSRLDVLWRGVRTCADHVHVCTLMPVYSCCLFFSFIFLLLSK